MAPRNPASSNESVATVGANAQPGTASKELSSSRAPVAPPSFTVGELRNAIPAHCWERSLLKSFSYLFTDLAVVAVLFYFAKHIDTVVVEETFGSVAPMLRHVLWTAYWVVQGCVMTGLWVIGHECGHGGFSPSELLNDVVGYIVHSALLVPYFAWKISHRQHHSKTGNMAEDEVFVPVEEENLASDNPFFYTAPFTVMRIVGTLTVGWFMYLFFNTTSHPTPGWANHFMPNSPIFMKKERHLIILSDIGVCAMLYLVYSLSQTYTFAWMLKMYIVPYLIVNFWLVLITLLQHTDPTLPHYKKERWNWLQGALATVDRDYGILNSVFHHIGDTHVTHHLFYYLPHYHAEEATVALRKVLGDYYMRDDTPIAVALWRTFTECHFVKADDSTNEPGVLWFRKVMDETKSA